MKAPLLPLLFLVTFVLFTAPAVAQKTAAEVLFSEARALMQQEKYAEAAKKLEESNRLDEGIGTLLNLAECYVQLGRTASAWTTYKTAAALASAKDQSKREAFAMQNAQQLEPDLATLTISVPPDSRAEDMVVTRDGDVVPQALWGHAVPIDPKTVRVEARAPGKATFSDDVRLEPSASRTLVVPPLGDDPAAAGPAAEPASGSGASGVPDGGDAGAAADAGGAGSTQRTAGWIVGGAGLAGGVAGAVLFLLGRSKIDDAGCGEDGSCPDASALALHEEGRDLELVGGITLGIGGALLATGIVLVATAPSEPDTLALKATAAGGYQGLRLEGTW